MHNSRICIFILFFVSPAIGLSQFTMVTSTPIVTDGRESSGLAWIDFDNDGDDDLFITVSTGGVAGTSTSDLLYRNNGDETFTRIVTGDPVNDNGTGRNSTWGDYDNDGFIDVFVVDQLQTTLYKNSATGFTKVNAIPTTPFSPSTGNDHSGAAWGDYDGDGYLDLYLASYQLAANSRNILYKNNKDGTFTQIPDTSPVTGIGYSMDPSMIDYNGDGLLDIVVPNYSGSSIFLYTNLGNGNFSSVGAASGLSTGPTEGVSWADYDNDGDFDVFFNVNYNTSNQLYENKGDGTFVPKPAAPATKLLSQSTAWGDFDNDGFIDLVEVGAYPFPGGSGTEGKTLLYKNNGDKTFTDVSAAQGLVSGFYSWSVACSDYNKDGFLDIVVANRTGNNHPPNNILYKNTPNGNNWINIKLKGTNSNRSAIGSNVRIKAGGRLQSRAVQGKTGYGAQNSLNVHFGIGSATKIDTVLVEWPLRGFQEVVNQVANKFIDITEINFPPAPSNLTAISTGGDVTITWKDNSSNETGFRVERSKGTPGNFKYIGTAEANASSFKDVKVDAGNYYYRVAASISGGFSSYTSISKEIVITDIEDDGRPGMSVYPNPVATEIHLMRAAGIAGTATISNLAGETVASFSIKDDNESISMGDLAPGLYVLKVGNYHFRILKK
jgi:hypothetical protein